MCAKLHCCLGIEGYLLACMLHVLKLRSTSPCCAQVYVHVQSQARSSYHLGYFADEAEAARAYDREILKVGAAVCILLCLMRKCSACSDCWTSVRYPSVD